MLEPTPYTEAKSDCLKLAFMDLSSAIDYNDRGKLWERMLEIGVDSAIVYFLYELHRTSQGTPGVDPMASAELRSRPGMTLGKAVC
ncbi:hypothetical protein NDU88_001880 [Pleurodeles waltl]|uniref:Uncharacterized protein n=1 Tax=Pleurodeles waltl TaxID=8319 RepID=A0AAV7M0W0_PLEWA|nr:hypothetical protein NDU88_001880 [Pleurodeles waltl]